MCDASAAVALTDDRFVVGSNQDSILRVYRREEQGQPVASFDLTSFLRVRSSSGQSDIEGAARIGNRVFWITSHGRNSEGEARPIRRQVFATDLSGVGDSLQLAAVGEPYRDLLDDLVRAAQLRSFRLAEAAGLAPEEPGGLNIEGLCATAEGHLLIGFRNPVPEGRALLVPLRNPNAILEGARAALGDPILLDLGGLGIRDMARVGRRYYLLAGPYNGKGRSQLFRWMGGEATPRLLAHLRLQQLHPEALVFWPEKGSSEFLILSDDGSRAVGGKPCQDLEDPTQRCFRGVWASDPSEAEPGDPSE